MTYQIDPNLTYRIRSRGVEQSPVDGHRLPQLVRDFVLARHDELSEDGEHWFPAGDVETLFPSATNTRLLRERIQHESTEHAEPAPVLAEDERKFPRDPWYVARGSNVAGPYDQLTIVHWYEEGSLYDDDQLRPGLHASWRPLGEAAAEGLFQPPPANSCSSSPIHLQADPPIWMGPPRKSDDPPIDQEIQAHPLPSSQSLRLFAVLFAFVTVILLFAVLLLATWMLVGPSRAQPESTQGDTVTRQLDP